MRIRMLKDKDGYKAGWEGFIERTLGRRFCEMGFAIPYQEYLDSLPKKKPAQVRVENAAKATSKKATGRSKATK